MKLEKLIEILQFNRIPITTEKQVQWNIHAILLDKLGSNGFKREVALDKKNIIDFTVDSIGIEIKIKGDKRKIFQQIKRYSYFDQIDTIILVTSKSIGLPETINGKPLFVINICKAWL